MNRYDIWLTNAPEGELFPLRCSECHTRFWDFEDHAVGEAHCYSEDDPTEVIGQLEVDESYDPSDDDPRIP